MPRRRTNDMQISERELLSMTHDLDEMHHATLPAMHAAIGEWADVQRGALSQPAVDPVAATELPLVSAPGTSRRRFLIGAGAAVGGVLLAACSSTKVAKTVTSTTTASGSGSKNPYTGDLAIAALAASLENLAVQTYGAGIKAAQAGQLGAVPPAIVTFATTAQSQHMAHAGAWNSILSGAGKPMVTGVDKTVQTAVVTPGFAQVKNATDLAKFALELEDAAAATYLGGIMALASSSNIKIAASIQPVEMQHSAILNFVIGNYPVPASFATTTGARTTSDTIG
ncbi:MAG: ferritin-like domain-containing protein [Acidimicrobiales bacterium]